MRFRLAAPLLSTLLLLAADASAQETPPVAPPPPAPPPPLVPPPPPPPPPHHMMMHMTPPVELTVESTNPEKNVVIERRTKTDETYGRTLFVIPQHSEVQTWEQVCVAPCRVPVDPRSTYRVGRENSVTRSGPFTLPPNQAQVKLEVVPGNYWWHKVSATLISGGIAAGVAGAAFLTTASRWDDKDDEKNARIGGIVAASIGVVFLAVGIPLAILTRTHVKANDKQIARTPPAPKLTLGGLTF